MKRIEFDGEIHEFPDDFTDDDISAALSAIPPKKPAAGMGDLKLAESQAGPIPEAPVQGADFHANPMAKVGMDYLVKPAFKFAGNLATSATTGILNAAAQGVQDEGLSPMGVAKAVVGNQVLNILDPFVPGQNWIQSTGKSLERAGVDNQPRPSTLKLPNFMDGGVTEMPYTSSGLANELGTVADAATPLYGVQAVKAAGMAARAALESRAIGKALEGAGKVAGAVNRGAGWTAAKATGVPVEALRAAGSPYGQARMAKNFGREKEIGDELLTKIDNAEDYIPERAIVDESLDKMGDLPLQPAIGALERGKGLPVAGRLSPEKAAANASVDKYIKFLRGGDLPEDLAQGAERAKQAAEAATVDAAVTGALAGQNSKASAQAIRAQEKAQKVARKAGERVATQRKHETDFGWWHDEAVQESKAAASQAREAAADTRARLAVGEISKADADVAQKAAEAADRNAVVADAAARLYRGEKIGDLAKSLTRERGFGVEDLRDVLTKARAKAQSVPDLPPQTVSARDYRDLRRDLDVVIDWDAEGAQIKNAALKSGRTTMKNELLKKAAESGDPKYAEAMQSWSDKLDKLERIKDLLGKTGLAREKRVEQFVSNLFGRNNKYKVELMRDIDEVFRGNTVAKAKAAANAKAFGESGKPGLLPVYGTGGSVNAAVNFGLALPKALGVLATAGTASPIIASRITLPFLTGLEKTLKAGQIKLSPKAVNAIAALKRPLSESQKVRLANILAAELEASMPANTIPFQPKKVAEEDDQDTSTLSLRTP